MKKQEKLRFEELERRVEETRNNPRFIELKEKEQKWLTGACEMTDEEMIELTKLYNENSEALIELTKWYNEKTYYKWKVATIFQIIVLVVYLFSVILTY